MDNVFTVAVIGCGAIAENSHFPAFEKLGNVRVKYACDIIRAKAEKMKEKYSFVENVIEDYRTALLDTEVEAVYVLTHNLDHYQMTLEALRAGKHVLCEKPVTVNYEMSLDMKREADKCKRILNIGLVNRFGNAANKLKGMIADGLLGDVYHVCCSFRAFHGIPGLGGPFTSKRESGGGALIDTGIHYLDLIRYVLGGLEIKNVTCDTYNTIGDNMKDYKFSYMWSADSADIENGVCDVDEFATGYIRAKGVNISFNGGWSQNLDIADRYIDFLGTKGGVRFDYGKKSIVFTNGQTLETEDLTPEKNNFFATQTEELMKSCRTGVKSVTNIDYILGTMELMDALYKSAELGKEVSLCE